MALNRIIEPVNCRCCQNQSTLSEMCSFQRIDRPSIGLFWKSVHLLGKQLIFHKTGNFLGITVSDQRNRGQMP